MTEPLCLRPVTIRGARAFVAEMSQHGPDARQSLVDEIAALDERREECVRWLAALDDAMRPAVRMVPNPGTMEREVA